MDEGERDRRACGLDRHRHLPGGKAEAGQREARRKREAGKVFSGLERGTEKAIPSRGVQRGNGPGLCSAANSIVRRVQHAWGTAVRGRADCGTQSIRPCLHSRKLRDTRVGYSPLLSPLLASEGSRGHPPEERPARNVEHLAQAKLRNHPSLRSGKGVYRRRNVPAVSAKIVSWSSLVPEVGNSRDNPCRP